MTIDAEFLIELDEFPDYFVGVDGVYSEKRGRMKKMGGSIDSVGYNRVSLSKDGKEIKKRVHRFIAQMLIPNPNNLSDVDHINHNRLDNRLENLRWVSHRDNGRNQSMSKKNTSGEQGVGFYKYGKYPYWYAHWKDNQKKQKSKAFSISIYGDDAKQLAIDYRKKMVDELYNRPKIVD
jgi:hypothetical protein